MLTATAIVFSVLIFPLFLNIKTTYSIDLKKLFFRADLFGFIKILSGYVETVKEGLAVHITEKKALIIPFANLLGLKKSFKPLTDYHFIKFEMVTEIGTEANELYSFGAGFLYNFVNSYAHWFLYHKKPYVKYENSVCVYEGENRFAFYISSVVVLNLLMIAISAIKILMEKIIYAIGKRKKQNQ